MSPLAITDLLSNGSEVDQLMEMLHEVIDPELGVDIVNLGLVYGLELNNRVAAITITTTTPACPMGDYISEETERVLMESGYVDDVQLVMTHSPLWSPEMMSEQTKRAFGWM